MNEPQAEHIQFFYAMRGTTGEKNYVLRLRIALRPTAIAVMPATKANMIVGDSGESVHPVCA